MRPVRFLGACVWFRDVTSFFDASGMVYVRVKVSQSSESKASIQKQVPTQPQTIPDALKKDVTSRNQTHAFRKRIGCMPCAFNLKTQLTAFGVLRNLLLNNQTLKFLFRDVPFQLNKILRTNNRGRSLYRRWGLLEQAKSGIVGGNWINHSLWLRTEDA